MRGAPGHGRLLHEQVIDDERKHGLREQRDADEHENQRRLGEDAEHHGTARSDAAVCAAGVESREHNRERAEREDEAAADDVAHVGERQREVGEHRNQDRHRHHAGERDDGGAPVDPRSRFGDHDLLAEQLAQVAVGWKMPGPRPRWTRSSHGRITPCGNGASARTVTTCAICRTMSRALMTGLRTCANASPAVRQAALPGATETVARPGGR